METTIKFGEHKGKRLSEVPQEYLEWLVNSRRSELAEYEKELELREHLKFASWSMAEKIFHEGYRCLAKKLHPDAGGSGEEFKKLRSTYEAIKDKIGGF